MVPGTIKFNIATFPFHFPLPFKPLSQYNLHTIYIFLSIFILPDTINSSLSKVCCKLAARSSGNLPRLRQKNPGKP